MLNVWDTYTAGKGVTIAFLEEHIDVAHPDLESNYKSRPSYSFIPRDATINVENSRGTMRAGLAVAADSNAVCGVGVVPHAGFSYLGLERSVLDGGDAPTASALNYMMDSNHIYVGPDIPRTRPYQNYGATSLPASVCFLFLFLFLYLFLFLFSFSFSFSLSFSFSFPFSFFLSFYLFLFPFLFLFLICLCLCLSLFFCIV